MKQVNVRASRRARAHLRRFSMSTRGPRIKLVLANPNEHPEMAAEPETVAFTFQHAPATIFINHATEGNAQDVEKSAEGIIAHETIHDVLDRMHEHEGSAVLDAPHYPPYSQPRTGIWNRPRRRRRR